MDHIEQVTEKVCLYLFLKTVGYFLTIYMKLLGVILLNIFLKCVPNFFIEKEIRQKHLNWKMLCTRLLLVTCKMQLACLSCDFVLGYVGSY